MGKQVGSSVSVLKGSDVPMTQWFPVIKQRTLEAILTVHAVRHCHHSARIFIPQVVGMGQQHIFSRGATPQHFWALSHPIRTEHAILLDGKRQALKAPLGEVLR